MPYSGVLRFRPNMPSILKLLACMALTTCALLGSLVKVVPAQAATPCWKALLNDWYDGRIDKVYARHCYQDALKHLPDDVATYSSARDDIQRALLAATKTASGETTTTTAGADTPVPPPGSDGSSDTNPVGREPRAGRLRGRRHPQPGRRLLGAGAAARARRARDPARRGGRGRADREARPGAPPAAVKPGSESRSRLRQVLSLSFRGSPFGSSRRPRQGSPRT